MPDVLSNGSSSSSILKTVHLLYEVPVNEAACIVCRPLIAESSPLCMVEASNAVHDLSQRILHHTSTNILLSNCGKCYISPLGVLFDNRQKPPLQCSICPRAGQQRHDRSHSSSCLRNSIQNTQQAQLRTPHADHCIQPDAPHLQLGEEFKLRLRHAGDDADDAVDGAEQQRRQPRDVAVRELHHQRPVPEPVHKLAQVVLAHDLCVAQIGWDLPQMYSDMFARGYVRWNLHSVVEA